MEIFLGSAASPGLLVGLFVGLTAWLGMAVLRNTWITPLVLATIAVSIITASGLLVALQDLVLIVPALGSYALGFLIASVIYGSLYRVQEGHWPVRSRRK